MPYYKKNFINLLFIHIPKTGGTSLENYFSKKFDIILDNNSLFDQLKIDKKEIIRKKNIHTYLLFKNISLHHLTYQNIIENKDILKINMDNLSIITIVRNPYERLMSDLFFFGLIEINTSPEMVNKIIKNYLLDNFLDNHNLPQYRFLIDKNENLIENIVILKTESLCDDLKRLGYEDFNIYDHINYYGKLNYYKYLNRDSIHLINNFYEKDFIYFNYEIKNVL